MIGEMYNPDRLPRVSGVSWWELGNEVYAMTEYKDGQQVDPHNIIAIGIGLSDNQSVLYRKYYPN